MNGLSVLAVLEPASFALDTSLAWEMIEAVRGRKPVSLRTDSDPASGSINGLLPILQPARSFVDTQPAFVLFMRARYSNDFDPADGEFRSVTIGSDSEVARLYPITAVPSSGVMISRAFEPISADTLSWLKKYVALVTNQLWPSEPVIWTTSDLHLTETGQFMSGEEMRASSIKTGIIQASATGVTLGSGIAPLMLPVRAWTGAGNVTALATEENSGYCSEMQGTDTNGDRTSGYAGNGTAAGSNFTGFRGGDASSSGDRGGYGSNNGGSTNKGCPKGDKCR